MLPFLQLVCFFSSVFFAFSNSDLHQKKRGGYLVIEFVLTSEIEQHLVVHHFLPLVTCSEIYLACSAV